LILLIAIAYKFSDRSDAKPGSILVTGAGASEGEKGTKLVLFSVVLLGLPVAASTVAPNDEIAQFLASTPPAPNCENCEYRLLENNDNHNDFSKWRGEDDSYRYKYRAAADTYSVSGALFCTQRPGSRLIQIGNMPGGAGWERLSGIDAEFVEVGEWKLEKRVYWQNLLRRTVYVGYYVNGKSVVSENTVKFETAMERLFSGSSAGAVFVVHASESSNLLKNKEKIEKFLSTFSLDQFLWSGLKPSTEGQSLCVA